MAVEVLVTGGDTELGRVVAEGFHNEGHTITLLGTRRDDLEVAAKEIEADAIVCDNTDPAALAEVRHLFPHHLDTIVNIPAPRWSSGDPRAYSLSDLATAWRNTLDDTVLSAVLTLQTVGDHLRSGGSIISVVPENARPGSAEAAVKAALASSALAVSPSTRSPPGAARSPATKGCPARRHRLRLRSPGCRCSSPPALPATSRARCCTSATAR
jgi:NAD(P)-dependent dehydrogenase (short-subunit alcohol dehydrogenase family)